ncbi:type III-B CRISPR module-associated protein Cmr3 [Sphingobacteriales bacterium UPWRP_1]|nr:type III-B CRISPR module-associated protein Cmr3 [Sphingobacteriales bacterium TSM_CSM]PSJ77798.1 type III-B CRISPR module-associated protein Cmr3 [Sphingobacteriales bacterium UPWRP_1]
MLIKINPLDTLFFRDGKPFSMGDDSWADSLFPPSPSVIYGAIRTLFLGKTNFATADKLALDEETQHINITGIYLQTEKGYGVPTPNDFAVEKSDHENATPLKTVLQPRNATTAGVISNKPLTQITYPNFVVDNEKSKGIITLLDLKDYLNAADVSMINPNAEYHVSEPKIGIGRDNLTFTTDEGKLYRVDMKRLSNKTQIVVELPDFTHDWLPFSKLGADSKLAHFEVELNKTVIEKIPFTLAPTDTMFKLYLATPAIFDLGWLPGWIKPENDYTGELGSGDHKITLQLTGTALGKPLPIGGFDLKAQQPKTMYRTVPAGSVYYFRLVAGTIEAAKELLHCKTISDQLPNEGYGLAMVGKI